MEKLIVLGTGNAGATRCYNTCFILLDGKEPLLVDAGGGNAIFTQLERAGIRPSDIHHAFLTHCHTDHLFGMIWMIRSVARTSGEEATRGRLRCIAMMNSPESSTPSRT